MADILATALFFGPIFSTPIRHSPAKAFCVHQLPGRLRLAIPVLRKNGPALANLRAELADIDGIGDVTVNVLTGSVVCRSDPRTQMPMDRIRERLASHGLAMAIGPEAATSAGEVSPLAIVLRAGTTELLSQAAKALVLACL